MIQPDELDLPQGVWRSVFSLRVDLRNGDFGLEAVRERLADEESGAVTRSGEVSRSGRVTQSALRDGVRKEYGIPPELGDETAEQSLSEALTKFVAGNDEAASDRLAETFSTVCEGDSPEQYEVGEQVVACHLYGSDSSSR